MKWLYNYIMWQYCRLRLAIAIRQLKRAGKKYGLPSLDGYSNDAIAEGFRRLKEAKNGQ